MSEHLLMALDMQAEEEEPLVLVLEGPNLRLLLDDGRQLLLDLRDVQRALLPMVEKGVA